jgi:hypothetical protein
MMNVSTVLIYREASRNYILIIIQFSFLFQCTISINADSCCVKFSRYNSKFCTITMFVIIIKTLLYFFLAGANK